jgi:wyosine [tRNA(Phe)-imidazoG37] synthetase (radical SAM superfamily)
MKYIFGPVMSRRLGVSLGIDLLPMKTCTLDCIYCECGATTVLTSERKEFFPTASVIAEIDEYLKDRPKLDYITFAGSGEPTLHTGIGTIIHHLKALYPEYKVAVLTNGTLLGDPVVQQDICFADLVVPSLDGATIRSFRGICRPVEGITPESAIAAIVSFRQMYKNRLSLEIFVVPGINDTPEELFALKAAAEKIRPDEIQLNYLARPGTVKNIPVPTIEQLKKFAAFFSQISVTFSEPKNSDITGTISDNPEQKIMELLSRRAASVDDIICTTGLSVKSVSEVIEKMRSKGLLKQEGNSIIRK